MGVLQGAKIHHLKPLPRTVSTKCGKVDHPPARAPPSLPLQTVVPSVIPGVVIGSISLLCFFLFLFWVSRQLFFLKSDYGEKVPFAEVPAPTAVATKCNLLD
jgi:hypothetical protein